MVDHPTRHREGFETVEASQYESLIRNIPGVVYRCLPDADWTMQFISDGILELSGYPASDFIDNSVRSFASIIHPADRDNVDGAVRAALERHQSYDVEYRILHRNGRTRWVQERGQGCYDDPGGQVCLDGAIIDVSLRRLAEDNLLHERERFRQVIANIPGVVYRTLLGETWTLEFVSEGVRELLGVEPADVIGKDMQVYARVVHPDDRELVSQIIINAASQDQSYEVKYRVIGTDGEIHWVFEKGRAQGRDAQGRRYMCGVIFDISRMRAAELELEAVKKSLFS